MSFARKVWKLLVAIKDGLALLFLLLFFLGLYALLSLRPNPGTVRDGALLLDLDGYVVEEARTPGVLATLAGRAPTEEFQARDVERALRLAAKDARIKVVVLDLSRFVGGGLVHMEEIGSALDAVRAAGKPVMTYASFYSDDSIMLAAHSTEAWVDPMGGAFVRGPGGTELYLKGLMDRFKVNAHIYRVGTYKSYVEPYLRTDMSDAARESNEQLYGALWNAWKADVAKARPRAQIDRVTSDPAGWARAAGGDMAAAAKAAGLVDRIGSRTEFDLAVAKRAGTSDDADDDLVYAHTSLADWLAANPASTAGAPIAVVTIAGDIEDGDGGPGKAEGERIARTLDQALAKGTYKALVLRVDSPGGSTMASERIRRSIERWRAAGIPVVVSMANMAASGGYWVSTAGQQIFARPGTITGSLGVFAVIPSFEGTLKQFGVTTDGVRTTPLSGQPDVFGGFTPEVDAMMQAAVENTYAKFLGLVGKSRGRTPQQIEQVAEGRPWDGGSALRLGLVDRMGGLDDALAWAANAAKLGNAKWHADYLGEKPHGLAALLAGASEVRAAGAPGFDFAGLVANQRDAQVARALQQVRMLAGTRSMQAYCLECPVVPGPAEARDDAAAQPAGLAGRFMALLAILRGG